MEKEKEMEEEKYERWGEEKRRGVTMDIVSVEFIWFFVSKDHDLWDYS